MAGWIETVANIRAVLFEEDEWWSAQCLDYDVAAQAKTLLELHDELVRVLIVQVAASAQLGREPFEGINPAPQRFWELYERGWRFESKPVPFRLEKGPELPPIRPELRIARSPATVD
jgi:hypothetical protein